MLFVLQVEDFKIWKHLQAVDLEALDHLCVPCVELLDHLKKWRDTNEAVVPFVELTSLCVPDWST